MHTRWSRPAGRMRPGLTLPELLAAIVVVAVLSTLILSHRCPTLPSPPSPPPPPPLAAPAPPIPPAPAQPPSNLLVNGSFEAGRFSFGCRSIPGWRISEGTVDIVSPGYWEPAPGQGEHSLDLVGTPGAASITQTFPTEAGREYCFSGWLAHNPERGHVDARANVYLNGRLLTQLYHREPRARNQAMGWNLFAIRFRTTAEAWDTLTITDVSNHGDLCGTVLDGLAVTQVPDR